MIYSLQGKRVWVAGHKGMVGSAIVRRLARENCTILNVDRAQVNLENQAEVYEWMNHNKPEVVFLAAATVGGILANSVRPVDFIHNNLMIQTNIISGAHAVGVQKLLFLGSSCIYPREATQPISEEELLSGPLEPTNQWYAIAKIAGIKLIQAYRQQYGCDFISCMTTNLYGPADNYHPENSHVVPALIRKITQAHKSGDKEVILWGTGTALREFLYVDDLADACVFLMQNYSDGLPINVGVGQDISIAALANIIAEVVGYQGDFVYDSTKPDGTPRKLLDTTRINNLGWTATTKLKDGIKIAHQDFLARNL